jgi:hypothetical protein
MSETLLHKCYEKRTDVFPISKNTSVKIINTIAHLLKNKQKVDDVCELSPKIHIKSNKKMTVIKHKKKFWVFTKLGSSVYESSEDVSIKDFLNVVKPDSWTKSNYIDFWSFYEDFSEEDDPWSSHIFDNIVIILTENN